ncbi:MAG: M28 family metallopeptidase [Promethearchaeota archaeon]
MKVGDAEAKEVRKFVEAVCEKFGPRYSCSESERAAQEWYRDQLSKFCDVVLHDEFQTHPNLYPQGIFKITGACVLAAPILVPMRFPFSLVAALLVGLGLFVLVSELFFMKEWVGFLFKKGTSANAFGVVRPTGEVRGRVVFEGHTDSPKAMRMAEFGDDPPLVKFALGLAYVPVVLVVALSKFFGTWPTVAGFRVLARFGPVEWTPLDWGFLVASLVLYPAFVSVVRGFTGDTLTLGANDNLSGAAVSWAVGKYFASHRPRHVEVWVGSTGSEEVGDQGAKAFVEKYGKAGWLDDALVFVLDSAGAGSEIFAIHKDTMHRATYSEKVIERIKRAHERVAAEDPDAIPCDVGRIPLGSTDACRYVHAGYEAGAIIVVDGALKKPRNWHSPDDVPENLDDAVLRQVLELCVRFVEVVDEELAASGGPPVEPFEPGP